MKNFDARVVDRKSHRFKPLGLSDERLPWDALATIPTQARAVQGRSTRLATSLKTTVQSLPDCVVERWPDLPDGLVAAIGPSAVRQ